MPQKTTKPTKSKFVKASWKNLRTLCAASLSDVKYNLPTFVLPPPPAPPVIIDKTKMRLTDVQYVAAASEDSVCFGAKILFENKHVATASNGGYGGPNEIKITDPEGFKKLTAWVQSLPPQSSRNVYYKLLEEFSSELRGMSSHPNEPAYCVMPMTLDFLVSCMMADYESVQSLENLDSTYVVGPSPHSSEKNLRVPQRIAFNRKLKPDEIQSVLISAYGHKWAHPFRNLVDPGFYHYYPAPHDFFGGDNREICWARVKATGEVAPIMMFETKDDVVALDFGKKKTRLFKPEELEHASGPAD